MRVFLTGGTGFIGAHLVRRLRGRGDEVVALVRSPEKAAPLREAGCEVVEGDLSSEAAIRSGTRGSDAVIHAGAVYAVGIRKRERGPMYEANVRGTEMVLRTALEEEIPRVLYVSTVGVFGDTHGRVVDETYSRSVEGFTSYYEETKVEAHEIARRLIDQEGLPGVIAQPGGVYGPKDPSQLGNMMRQFLAGRMPLIAFPDTGVNFVHVDDAAEGILLGLDRGQVGEQYVFGGTIGTLREYIQTIGRVAGKKPPRRTMPTAVLKASAPLGPLLAPVLGYPPNLRELISSADGVTFWAKHDKAIERLGYSPRGLEQGIRDTLEAEGTLPADA